MELNLGRDVKNNKRFYRYIGQKGKAMECPSLWYMRREKWQQWTQGRLRYLRSSSQHSEAAKIPTSLKFLDLYRRTGGAKSLPL